MKQIIKLVFISCQPKAAEESSSVTEMATLSQEKKAETGNLQNFFYHNTF